MDDQRDRPGNYLVYAYLDSASSPLSRLLVCQGSKEECGEFIAKQQFLEGLFQWVGYIVVVVSELSSHISFKVLAPRPQGRLIEGTCRRFSTIFFLEVLNLTESCCFRSVSCRHPSGDVGFGVSYDGDTTSPDCVIAIRLVRLLGLDNRESSFFRVF